MEHDIAVTVCEWIHELKRQKESMEASMEKLQDYISYEELKIKSAKEDIESKKKMIETYVERIVVLTEVQDELMESDFMSSETFDSCVRERLKTPPKPIPCPNGIIVK